MTVDYINNRLSNFYKLFIINCFIVLFSFCVLFLNQELLLVPIFVTLIIIYMTWKKIPEYIFWIKVKSLFDSNDLDDYIDSEYDRIKNNQDYLSQNPKRQIVTGTRMNVQYQSEKEIFSSTKKFNKVKYLLKLKRLLENERLNGNSE